ncbi:hypothetical protein E4T39_00950 [Aureobasidium subglaciale]|nr:hypothetical protein E4T39_00950 [Aureobasidium subglaciale]
MSQDRSNLGYYDTYDVGMAYTSSINNKGLQTGQLVHSPMQTWSSMPAGHAAVSPTKIEWSGQCYPHHEGWHERDILSSSDMTSETNVFDDSATPSLHRSDSGDFSEVWEQEPPSMPFSPSQAPVSSHGLLDNIGSGFPFQLPPCVAVSSDGIIQQYDSMLSDLDITDSLSSPTVLGAPSHTDVYGPSFSNPRINTQQSCIQQSHEHPLPGGPKKVRQAKEPEDCPSRRPARANSSKARLFCEACRDSKDYSRGFRGEHELARHYAQKHTKHKKVWKCFDLSADHLMRNCERCKTGHQYGTSYGGAEHFRRKHTGLFGKDMMELLRGKNQRWALSSNRLVEEGWLRQVFVPGDGEPYLEQEQHIATVMHTPLSFTGSPQETSLDSGVRMTHLQTFHQPQVLMHDANLAWAQYQHQLQPYNHQHLRQGQQQHQRQQQ